MYLGGGRVEDPCEVADLVGRTICGQKAELDGGPALRGQADAAGLPLFQLGGRGERVRATAVRPHVRECHLEVWRENIIFNPLAL
jgi:hypothetical protein